MRGLAAATGDIVVFIDADGSNEPCEVERFVLALVNGADFAKGSRFIQGGGSVDITPIRRLGNCGVASLDQSPVRHPLHGHRLRLQRGVVAAP